MKEKIIAGFKEIVKDVGKQTLVALILAAIFALFGLIPSTRPYFLKLFFLIYINWMKIILLMLLPFMIYLLYKNKRLLNSYNVLKAKIDDFQKIPSTDETIKKFSDLNNVIEKIKKAISGFIAHFDRLDRDVYEMKRDYLYKQAEKHGRLGQRGELLCRLEVIDLDIERDPDFSLKESLRDLFDYVKNVKAFSTKDLSDTKNCLDKIQNKGDKAIVDQIIAKIEKSLS